MINKHIEKAQIRHARFESEDDFSALIKEFKAKLEVRKRARKRMLDEFCKSMTNTGDIQIQKIPMHCRHMPIQDYLREANEEADEKPSGKNYIKPETPYFKPSCTLKEEKLTGRVLRSAKSSTSSDNSVKSFSSNKSVKRTKSQKKTTAKKMVKIEKKVMCNKTPIIELKDCVNDEKLESLKAETTTNKIIKSKIARTDYYECTLTAVNQPSFKYVVKNKPAVILPNMRLISIDDVESVQLDETTRDYLETVKSFLNALL